MSSERNWIKCKSLILVMVLVGCLQRAPTAVEDHSALLVVAHMSEGEAPTLRALSLKPSGSFTYGYIGLRSRRGTLSGETVRTIRDLMQKLRDEELQSSEGIGMDQEQIVIEFDQRQVIFLIHDLPESVRDLLEILDAAVGTELGARYEPFASISLEEALSSDRFEPLHLPLSEPVG